MKILIGCRGHWNVIAGHRITLSIISQIFRGRTLISIILKITFAVIALFKVVGNNRGYRIWCPYNFWKKLDQKTKILAVAEIKNINSASSNEHLKIGEKRVKRGHFVTSNGHHRRRGGRGGLKIFLGTQLFMLYSIPKFGAILRGRSTKIVQK